MTKVKTPVKTPFEVAQEQVAAGKLQTPSVSYGTKPIDYFGFQLATHRFNLKVMAGGMTCKGIKFTDIKKYYGLKGRTAKDCLEQFEAIIDKYKESLTATA
jgi:hypothetical protein